jgi:hypothetical protein
MKETTAIIERVTRLNEHYQWLHLAVDDSLTEIKPGQSVLARRGDRWDPYLREQWWPAQVNGSSLIIERPSNISYEPGEVVSLLGLLGQPFRYRRTLRNVLLMAYDAPPTALVFSITTLIANKISVSLVLSGRAQQYPTQNLPREVEVLKADDDLNWPNRVMTVGWADQVFVAAAPDQELACFSKVWTLFSQLRSDIPKAYLFGVFQPTQPCGVGACQACMIALKGNQNSLICTDGPAIDLSQVPLG